MNKRNSTNHVMNRTACWMFVAIIGLGLAACQSTRPDRDWVQTNVVDKDLFQGEWHYARTVVDNDHESMWLMAFKGDVSFAVEGSIGFSIPRVRWVIDESYLYAFRADPIVTGADEDEFEPDYYSGLLAAFPVDSHLDIIRSYNPVTGERLNVVSEDTNERAWYDRQYMRVDWSENLVTGFNWSYTELMGVEGFINRESVSYACNEGTDQPYVDEDGNPGNIMCREEWLPQVRLTDPDFDAVYGTHYASELREDACRNPVTGEVPETCDGSALPYMFSFVNLEIWTPTIAALSYLGTYPFTAVKVAVRNTFVRSPERASYEPLLLPDTMWDRFGAFRLERGVYTGGEGEDPVEGIEPLRGLTDMLEYWAARHNMWVDYRDESGEIMHPSAREKRHIVYYLNAGFPKWLVPAAFRVAEEWNVEFMRAFHLARNGAEPASYDCTVTRGDESYRDDPENMPETFSHYDDIYSDPPGFEGDDCVLVLRVNSADLPAGTYTDAVGTRTIARDGDGNIDMELSDVEPYGELLGDYRFQFLNAIDNPGAPFGGISTLRADVRNGELITANANVAMESMLRSMMIVLQWMGINASLCEADDIVDPSVCAYMAGLDLPDLTTIMNGEDVRSYFAELGQVERPVTPVTPEALNAPSTEYNSTGVSSVLHSIIHDRAAIAAEKAISAGLAGPEGGMLTYSQRLYNLEDTRFEQMLFDPHNPETLALLAKKPEYSGGIDRAEISGSQEAILDEISFFRTSPAEQMWLEQRRLDKMARLNMYPEHPMLDYAYANLAEEFASRSWSAAQIALHIANTAFYNVMSHELGHSLGMRHNFAGSIDYYNYKDCYWNIAEEHPWPDPNTSDESPFPDIIDAGVMTFEETVEFSRGVARVDDQRDNAGINLCQSTSTMDYSLNYIYDWPGLGKYDAAYIDFMYAGMVEAYDGDPRVASASGSRLWEWIDPRRVEKVHWKYYMGGERCETDKDCPFSVDKYAHWPEGQQVTQRCLVHPDLPIDADPSLLPRICSNFYDDFYNKLDNDWPSTGAPYYWVEYMFCSDERTGDISWCNRFDRGSSFREVINNWKDYYHKAYPFSWFRRYRRNYGGASGWNFMIDMIKIYQHWLYRWFYEPGYTGLEGPLQFDDQYLASLDAIGFFQEVIGTPDVGLYKLDPVTNNYYKISEELSESPADDELNVPLGMGKYMWSSFQDGPMGVYELERMGMHWDKIYALMGMSIRDWNLMYTYDERFTINFYSLFDWEIQKLFGGVILDDPTKFGPRWYTDGDGESFLYYPSVWRGHCHLYGPPTAYCPEEYYDDHLDGVPAFENSTNEIIRNFAAIFSLAEFPIFYDTRYEQQLFVCERGSGYCFDICETGSTAHFCGDPSYELVRGEHYETYTSDRLHKTFQAVAYEDLSPYEHPPDVDNSLALLSRANDLQDALGDLEAHQAAGTCPPEMTDPCDEELEEAIIHTSYTLSQHESFLINLIDIQREYGITSWL